MKYFSMFSGIGGFELGIQQAYENYKSWQQESIWEGSIGGSIQSSRDIPNDRGWRGESQSEEGYRLEQWLCIGYSEIDKYAIQIYERHFKHKNYGDATTINASELPDFDLLVGGFPCQAFSIAGKRLGLEDSRGTLFYDIARIAKEKRPQHLLLENVKGLLSHDNGRTFKLIITTFAELGYDLEWQVLNSKNFGVPQNRERVFIIGHLGRCCGRQVFPLGEGNQEYAKGLKQLNTPKFSSNRIYSKDGISPNLRTMQGGNLQPKVWLEPQIRRLTPTECERLQGYPDGWTEGVSDSQRYKCLGNSVTVNVIEEIIKRLYE